MARHTIVSLVDDIDGTEAVDTVEFGLDGKSYAVDLSADNATRLRDSLAEFVAKARRISANGAPSRPVATSGKASLDERRARKDVLAKIRTWARAKGMKVEERGRVATEIEAAYWADGERDSVVAQAENVAVSA